MVSLSKIVKKHLNVNFFTNIKVNMQYSTAMKNKLLKSTKIKYKTKQIETDINVLKPVICPKTDGSQSYIVTLWQSH